MLPYRVHIPLMIIWQLYVPLSLCDTATDMCYALCSDAGESNVVHSMPAHLDAYTAELPPEKFDDNQLANARECVFSQDDLQAQH